MAVLLMDYQNVHLSAWERMTSYGTPKHHAKVQPGKFADEVERAWAEKHEALTIDRVIAFRGLPDPRKQPTLNSFVNRDHAAWSRDPRVTMRTRPLRYPRDWPDEAAQEKGIDVLLALEVVTGAANDACDRVFVATRDTDLEPAFELAERLRPGCATPVYWAMSSRLRLGPGFEPVVLDKEAFERCRQPRDD